MRHEVGAEKVGVASADSFDLISVLVIFKLEGAGGIGGRAVTW